MSRNTWIAMGVGAGLLTAMGVGLMPAVRAADDDLAVVKRAVAVSSEDKETSAPAARRNGRRPSWLKVSIIEQKEGKKEAKVSVTLPLALLAALGRDATVDVSQFGVKGLKDTEKNIRIMDVLESLEPGTMLVEVREENEHVRIWVE